jgi:hypothetical protein
VNHLRYFLFILFSLNSAIFFAQDIPTPLVEESFVKPGIRNTTPGKGLSIRYFVHPTYQLETDENGDEQKSSLDSKKRLDVKLKIPLWLRERTKFLIGFYHSFEQYDFDNINPEGSPFLTAIDDRKLKRTRGTAYYLRSLNKNNYILLRFGASYNGAYDQFVNFDNRYAVYRFAAVVGIKKKVDREWGVGLLVTKNFQRILPLPIVIFNRTFNERWGIETAIPAKVKLRRNFSETSMLTMGYEYYSSAYSVDVYDKNGQTPTDYIFKSSAVKFSVKWHQRALSSWTWASLEAGYALNFDSRFIEVGNIDNRIQTAPSNSFFISMSFFISPPKEWVRDEVIENTIEEEIKEAKDDARKRRKKN